jgi:hypothetical protein
MNLTISGFSLNNDFIPAHDLKVNQTPRYNSKPKANFLNFFVYCTDEQMEITNVGCNKGGIISFIQSQKLIKKTRLDVHHKQFIDDGWSLGTKRLPESFLANLNDMHLDMNFVSWDGFIDTERGDIAIVGLIPVKDDPELVFWTHILISPTMLDYTKATLPVEQRFTLADMRDLYSNINAA